MDTHGIKGTVGQDSDLYAHVGSAFYVKWYSVNWLQANDEQVNMYTTVPMKNYVKSITKKTIRKLKWNSKKCSKYQRRRKKKRKQNKKQKTKKEDPNPNISTITLNINGLNKHFNWIFFMTPIYAVTKKGHN